MAVQEILFVAATPERVWALLDDADMLPLWMPDVIETIYPDGRPSDGAVGTRFVQRMRDARGITEYQGVVTAYAFGRHLAVELMQPMFTLNADYRLEPIPGGTRLDFIGDVVMHNPLLRLMALAASPITSAVLKRQIGALKRVAESEPIVAAVAAAAPRVTKRPAAKSKTRTPVKASRPTPKRGTR